MVSACVRVGSARFRLPPRIVLIWFGDHIVRFPFGSASARFGVAWVTLSLGLHSVLYEFGSAVVLYGIPFVWLCVGWASLRFLIASLRRWLDFVGFRIGSASASLGFA